MLLPRWQASSFSNVVATFALVYVFLWNVSTLNISWPYLSPPPESIGNLLALDQTWDMFAPMPFTLDGWYVIPAVLKDGTEVNLFTDGKAVSWEKTPSLSAIYKNDRWRSYMMNLIMEEEGKYCLPYYAHYLCRQWDETHPIDKQIVKVDIFFMMKINSLKGPSSPPKKTLL